MLPVGVDPSLRTRVEEAVALLTEAADSIAAQDYERAEEPLLAARLLLSTALEDAAGPSGLR